jgi:hypothetical protein
MDREQEVRLGTFAFFSVEVRLGTFALFFSGGVEQTWSAGLLASKMQQISAFGYFN